MCTSFSFFLPLVYTCWSLLRAEAPATLFQPTQTAYNSIENCTFYYYFIFLSTFSSNLLSQLQFATGRKGKQPVLNLATICLPVAYALLVYSKHCPFLKECHYTKKQKEQIGVQIKIQSYSLYERTTCNQIIERRQRNMNVKRKRYQQLPFDDVDSQ